MADNIFVGSVSVGVVPDLRGFNTKLRAGLLPEADLIGKQIGRAITKGISSEINMSKVIKEATPKATIASNAMGQAMGKELTKGVADTFNIGKIVLDATRTAKPVARLAGKDLGDTYGKAFRRGLDDALKGVKAKVDIDLNQASLARAKAAIRGSLGGGVNVNLGLGGGGGGGGGVGGGGGGVAAAAGGAGFIGGLNALLKALPGGTSGSIAAVPAPILAGAGAIAAALLPGLGQILAGVIPALGGGAIAGLGIAGAFGAGGTNQQQVAQARATSQAADARVRAAQARIAGLRTGVSGPSALTAQAAGLRLGAAQERLQTALGGTSPAAILSAQAGVASAQDRINKLRATGGATTAQLAAAEASLASARASQAKASQAYQKAQADQITKGQQSVRDSFKQLAQDAKTSLGQIGAPMVPAMREILTTVDKTMKFLTPVFRGAVRLIAGPFQVFSTTILDAFKDPQVTSAIQAVAKAFADVTVAFTPDIKGIMDSFADAIERIAASVSKNPKAFADFLNFVFQFGIMLLNAIAYLSDFATWLERVFGNIGHVVAVTRHYVANQWDLMWQDTVGRTIRAQRHLQILINDWLHNVAHWFSLARHWVAIQWDQMWQDTVGRTIRAQRHLQQLISDWLHNIANLFDIVRHTIASIWDTIWNNTIGRAQRGVRDLMSLFSNLKTNVINFFAGARIWLTNAGNAIISGLFSGIQTAMSAVGSFIKRTVVDPVVNAVKHFFGIKSPSVVMAAMGANIIKGLMSGMFNSSKDLTHFILNVFGGMPAALGHMVEKTLIGVAHLPARALKALGSVAGKIGGFFAKLFGGGGSGVQRWAGTVAQALAMLGLPLSLGPQVLHQISTESGGNPNAINLTDINAQHGDPSRGLLQTIGSTFAAYHVPGTSRNIYDPLANIAAAINYAMHVYGPSLMRGGMGLGSGHGYAAGTGGASPGWAWVGEKGKELVYFSGGETVIPNGGFPGYATGTVSAAQAIAASNRAAAASIAASNRMARAGASLAAAIAKITLKTTAAVFGSDQAKFLADLRLYFNPNTARARSQLIIRQITELQNLQAHIKTLSTNIANATALQQQTYGQLRSATGVGTIGIQGVGAAGGRSILSGLQQRLTATRSFGLAIRDLARAGASQAVLRQVAGMDPASGSVYARKMISALNKMHSMKLSPEMITQLVALGPDAALAYVNAIQAGGPSLLKQVKSTEAALEASRIATSRGVASVISGGAYITGANFVAGLKSQQKNLEKQFAHLGRVLGTEAVKWMRVPSNKRPYGYQHGGWLNEPVSGVGMYSGAMYTFAETGREYVMPEGQMGAHGGDGGSQYHAHFDGLTGAAIESHVRTAFTAMSMQQGALNRAGRRS